MLQIDGLGAILSAFLLGIVLVRFEALFGIPKSTLYFLALLPCIFAIYDFYCFYLNDTTIKKSLKRIAIANLTYCGLSIGLAFYHIGTIKNLGWIYILIEVLIVVTLALIELRISRR